MKSEKIIHSIFGKRFKEKRIEKGLSVIDLYAMLYNIAPENKMTLDSSSCKTIYNWQDGISMPNYDDFVKLCKTLGCSADYLLGIDNCCTKDNQFISDTIGLSDKAIERLERLKQKNNGINQERLNAISMLFEECPDFPYLCLDFYSLCLNMANERKSERYIHGLTNNEDIALSAFMQNENLRLMRDKLIAKMKNEKTDYFIERVYLPVFSGKAADTDHYSKQNRKG